MYDINSTIQKYKEIFACDKNFDLVYRTLTICERQAAIFFVDGFTKEAVLEKMLEFFYSVDNPEFMKDAHTFYQNCVPYNELEMTSSEDTIVKRVLSGMLALFVEGFSECILIDLRTYPQRDTSEPEKDKVFRGSKDGFVETLILNTALIRRRIRTPKLRFEHIEAGKSSKTDIALCYIEGKADSALVDDMRKRLKNLDIDALTMNQQSVADKILPQKWYNPFPKVKYSERPDTTSAQILEGDICILVDNSPSAMIMPANLFDLMDEANDYYFPPVTGTYLRLTRFIVMLLTVFLTPLWLMFIQNPDITPQWLSFINVDEVSIPVFVQLIILEIAVDGLKLALLYTPNMLSTSLSMVGAIILGDFAVDSGWFSSEALLYMAFVTIANYSIPSIELGYALKFSRIIILISTFIFNIWGFVISTAAIFVLLVCSKTVTGKGYLYPLIPLNLKALTHKLFRLKENN